MENKVNYSGLGFLPLLGLLFIGLKLCHVITWSWWWVLAPLWAPITIFLSMAAACGILYLLIRWFNSSTKQ